MSESETYTKVRDVMTPHIEMVDGLATVEEVIGLMKEKHFSALAVARRDEKDEYGFISVHDIASKVVEKDLSPDRVSVYEVMEKPALTLRADMNVRYAIRLLERSDYLCALVVDEKNDALGIVTMFDMVIDYVGK